MLLLHQELGVLTLTWKADWPALAVICMLWFVALAMFCLLLVLCEILLHVKSLSHSAKWLLLACVVPACVRA